MSSYAQSVWTSPKVAGTSTNVLYAMEPEHSSTAYDRLLTARLGYTCVQRAAAPVEQRRVAGGQLLSFVYKVLGVPTGLHEGVLLGAGEGFPLPTLMEFAGDVGANLLKVTRVAAEAGEPGQVRVEQLRRWTVVHRAARARELLPLGLSYDDTLASFGRHTRRNIRNVRKIASESGFTFEASDSRTLLSPQDHAMLARHTRPKGVDLPLARRLEAHAGRASAPLRSVVRAPNGAIVSYACGYFGKPGSAYLLYQLNNPAFHAMSPSLLHRAHLIEWSIERSCDELAFVHGCTGVLRNACVRQPLEELLLMRRTPLGYLTASPIAFAKAESSLGRLVRAAVFPNS